MRIRQSRPRGTLAIIGLVLVLLVVWIWKVPPESWWTEGVGIVLAGLCLWLTGAWISGKRRYGWVVAIGVTVLLILRRWEVLDALTLGLTLGLLGLITLII